MPAAGHSTVAFEEKKEMHKYACLVLSSGSILKYKDNLDPKSSDAWIVHLSEKGPNCPKFKCHALSGLQE